jgi:hypothetical protein
MPQLIYQRAKQLMEAELGDELVALDPVGGECFGFNDVAATIWRLLDVPSTVAELTRSLTSAYAVDAAQCALEVDALLAQMVGRGLVSTRTLEP